MIGSRCVSQWSSTQATIALSVGEAELNALTKAGREILGVKSLCLDLGFTMSGVAKTDSSAANGIVHRLGCGKLKHLSTKQMWFQQVVARKQVFTQKVPRAVNLSDSFTHHWSYVDGSKHFSRMNLHPPLFRMEALSAQSEGGCRFQ